MVALRQRLRCLARGVPGSADGAPREEQAYRAGVALVRGDVERRVPLTGARVNVGSCVEQDADQLRRGLGIALTRRYRTRLRQDPLSRIPFRTIDGCLKSMIYLAQASMTQPCETAGNRNRLDRLVPPTWSE